MGLLKLLGVGSFFDYLVDKGALYVKQSLGHRGVEIDVYKIRTMHSGSDRFWEVIGENTIVDNSGNPVEDNRIIEDRAWLRRFGVDEMPQLYNVLEGDMSWIGIRPRERYWWEQLNAISPEIMERALQFKPGWVAIQYGTKERGTIDEFIERELRYLEQKEQEHIKTDIIYFLRFLYFTIVKGVRSR